MAFPVPNSWISIIFHSIPVHNFASRDLQLIPVLQEIEYIPRTRTYCLELKICETKKIIIPKAPDRH
eukprot:UN2614